jgi:hypothetical protein
MKGILRARRYTRHDWKELLLPAWQVGLALVALLDILNCWSIIMNAWAAGGQSDDGAELVTTTPVVDERNNLSLIIENVSHSNDTCAATNNDSETTQLDPTCILPTVFSLPSHLATYIGPIFCLLCIFNGVVRARRAQQLAYENAALDVFETKLASLCTSARCSFRGGQDSAHQQIKNGLDHELAHNSLFGLYFYLGRLAASGRDIMMISPASSSIKRIRPYFPYGSLKRYTTSE